MGKLERTHVRCYDATNGLYRRRPAQGRLDTASRTVARNLHPADADRDNPARWLRRMARFPVLLSIRRGLDLPGCRNRFWRRRSVFFLPRAGRCHAAAVEIDAATAMVRDESSKMTFHSFDRCRAAGPSTSNECGRASGNKPGRKAPHARRRAASTPGISGEMNRSASRFYDQKLSASSGRRRRLDNVRGSGVEDKSCGLPSMISEW